MIGLALFFSIYKLVLDADIIMKGICVLEGLRWSGTWLFGIETMWMSRYEQQHD